MSNLTASNKERKIADRKNCIQCFEIELELYQTNGTDATTIALNRNILLSKIGPTHLKCSRPDVVNTKRYDDVKMTMRSFYERKVCLLNDGRSICEWLVVTNLFYNSSIRLLLQTANLALHWLKEYVINWLSESTILNSNKSLFLIFQKNWPNDDVEASVQLLKQATLQSQRLESFKKTIGIIIIIIQYKCRYARVCIVSGRAKIVGKKSNSDDSCNMWY